MRKITMTGLAAASALMLAACSGAPASTPDGGEGASGGAIAFLNPVSAEFTSLIGEGIAEVAEAAGYEVTEFDAAGDTQKQVSQCTDAVSSGRYVGMILEPLDGTTLVNCVESAIAAGIEIAVIETAVGPDPWNEEIQVEGISLQYILSPMDLAAASAEMATSVCEGIDPCEAVYSLADPSSYIFTVQHEETVAALNDVANIEVVADYIGGYDNPAQSQAGIIDVFRTNPNISVVVGDDDGSLQGVNRWIVTEGLSGQIKTIGNGASEAGLAAIRAGEQYGTIALFPKYFGAAITEQFLGILAGTASGPITGNWADLSPLGPGVLALTAENIDEYAE